MIVMQVVAGLVLVSAFRLHSTHIKFNFPQKYAQSMQYINARKDEMFLMAPQLSHHKTNFVCENVKYRDDNVDNIFIFKVCFKIN